MNDVIKTFKRPKVTYQPDDDDQLGSAEDYDESEIPNIYSKPTKTPHENNGRHNNVAMFGIGGIATRKPMYPIPEVRGSSDNEVSTAISSAPTVGYNYRIFFVVNLLSLLSFGRFLS